MRAKFKKLAGALRSCCGQFPPPEPHNPASLDGGNFGAKTLA
jgi:hypothetical protein